MTAIEQITTVAASLGWRVQTDTSKPNLMEFDFQLYTSKGQDFSFSVAMKNNYTDHILIEIEEYYESLEPAY